MRITVVAAALIVAATPARLTANEPDASLRRTVAESVAELASPLRRERVQAEKRLLELGPTVLDRLPPIDEIRDQATRLAVRRIRVRLERIAAEQSVLASRVTLRGRISVQDVAAQLQRQTGNRIDADRLDTRARDQMLVVDWEEAPFWECLAALCSSVSIAWKTDTNDGTIRLFDAETGDKASYADSSDAHAFRVAIQPLTRRRGTLRASVTLTSEPRLRPLFVRIADADFSAETERGTLSLFNPQAVTELPMIGPGPVQLAVLFREPDDAEISSTRVSGQATVHVAAGPVEFRFDDLSGERAVYQRRGGVSLRLKQAELERTPDDTQQLTARLAVAYDSGGPEFESHRPWIHQNECRLEHEDGSRRPPESVAEIARQANGAIEFEYRFSDLPSQALHGWQLVYVAPTLLIEAPVEFEFEDVPVDESSDKGPESSDE